MAKKPTTTAPAPAEPVTDHAAALEAPPIGPNEPAAVAAETAAANAAAEAEAVADSDASAAAAAEVVAASEPPAAEYVAPETPMTTEEAEAFRLEQEAVANKQPGFVVLDKVIYVNDPCPACGGKGTVKCSNPACGADHKCGRCNGTGKRRLNTTEALLIHHAKEQRAEGNDVIKTGECANVVGGAVSTVQVTLGRLAEWGLFERLTQGKAPDSSKTEWRLAV